MSFRSWAMGLSRVDLLFEVLCLFILSRWSLVRVTTSTLGSSSTSRLKCLLFGRGIESTAHNQLPFLPAFLPKYWLINDHTLQVTGPLSWAFGGLWIICLILYMVSVIVSLLYCIFLSFILILFLLFLDLFLDFCLNNFSIFKSHQWWELFKSLMTPFGEDSIRSVIA